MAIDFTNLVILGSMGAKLRSTIEIAKPDLGIAEILAAVRVIRSGNLAQGSEVAKFEEEFSSLALDGNASSIAVNSGTNGLILSLMALGIKKGDEVIVPSFTFAATANAVVLAGGVPIFADVELSTFNLDPAHVESLITSRTMAIMPVHLYGNPAKMKKFQEIASKHSLALIEDAAQAHLAETDGQKVGTFGDCAVFSFYPTKNMTSAEGGMVTTKSPEITRKIKLLRNQGMEIRYQNEIAGFNNRMSDLHAAIGRAQLGKLEKSTNVRLRNAEFLSSHITGVNVPIIPANSRHVFHQYTLTTIGSASHRDDYIQKLTAEKIGTGIYYPTPVHRLPSFSLKLQLQNTELLAGACFSIPVRPGLSRRELEEICEVINSLA